MSDFKLTYEEANALVATILNEAEIDRHLAGHAISKVVEERMRRVFKPEKASRLEAIAKRAAAHAEDAPNIGGGGRKSRMAKVLPGGEK